MNPTTRTCIPCMVIAAAATLAWAMGGNHPKGEIKAAHGGWPDKMISLINGHDRVHGHWVNANDEFFYRGDAAALEKFLTDYAAIEGIGKKLVIHVASKRRSTLWGDRPDVPYDWKLLICKSRWGGDWGLPPPGASGYTTQIDVWLGTDICLEDLRVPNEIPIESAGELEAFIRCHNSTEAPADGTPTTRPTVSENDE
jgi:hypothetical protein